MSTTPIAHKNTTQIPNKHTTQIPHNAQVGYSNSYLQMSGWNSTNAITNTKRAPNQPIMLKIRRTNLNKPMTRITASKPRNSSIIEDPDENRINCSSKWQIE